MDRSVSCILNFFFNIWDCSDYNPCFQIYACMLCRLFCLLRLQNSCDFKTTTSSNTVFRIVVFFSRKLACYSLGYYPASLAKKRFTLNRERTWAVSSITKRAPCSRTNVMRTGRSFRQKANAKRTDAFQLTPDFHPTTCFVFRNMYDS